MAEAAPKRLTFEYRTGQATGTDQGTIHAELMVFERGSWVALPVYQPSCDTVNGRQVVSGYVESQTDRKFRANLTYTCNAKRTARWQIDHPILSAMYVDGRRKPVCEHTIQKHAYENPVDLTSCNAVHRKLFANVPSEADTSFSWKKRSQTGPQIACKPPGTTYIDEQSSISFRLSKCEIRRIMPDMCGKAAFPSTEPSLTPGKKDKYFEPTQETHRRLSHYISIDGPSDDATGQSETISDFEVTSAPFVEFKFYYKSRTLLEELEIAPPHDIYQRPRRGLASPSKSLSEQNAELPFTRIVSGAGRRTHGSQVTPSQPTQPIVQTPSSRTISGKSARLSPVRTGGYTGMRAVPLPSPEASRPSSSSSVRPQLSNKIDTTFRQPTPYPPRPLPGASPPRKRPASVQQPPLEQPSKKQKTSPHRMSQAGDNVETASLPSPPASPVPSVQSDGSLPSISDLLKVRKHLDPKLKSPSRPSAGSSNTGVAKYSARASASRPQVTAAPAGPSTTSVTPKKVTSGRPPLVPGARKDPGSAEKNSPRSFNPGATAAAVGNQSAQVATQTSPQTQGSRKPTLPTLDAATSAMIRTTPAAAPTTSSPPSKPTLPTSINSSSETLPLPQAGPSTPRASAPREIAKTAKKEETTPKIKTGSKIITVKQEGKQVIDLTLESENEEEDKKDVKVAAALAASKHAASASQADIARREAYEKATELLQSLDIYDIGNVHALVSAGYKSTASFVKKMPLLDEAGRSEILNDMVKEMGKLDFGILRVYFRKHGLELEC